MAAALAAPDDPRVPLPSEAQQRAYLSERERARRFATTIVSAAIAILGLTLVVFAVFLVVYGGLGFFFLALLIGIVGAGLALLGLFFQLVPFRLQELADAKRENDRRAQEP